MRSGNGKSLESWIWDAACSIRRAQDAPKYKNFILPLVFTKRLCDVFDDELMRVVPTLIKALDDEDEIVRRQATDAITVIALAAEAKDRFDLIDVLIEQTRQRVRPDVPGCPNMALIVTSRREEELGDIPRAVLRPQRVSGNRLSSFMEAYLSRKGVRDQFKDSEYFDACGRISNLVGTRETTGLPSARSAVTHQSFRILPER